jgi:hypothetical protein
MQLFHTVLSVILRSKKNAELTLTDRIDAKMHSAGSSQEYIKDEALTHVHIISTFIDEIMTA